MPKTCSSHKPSGWLHPLRRTRCPWLCCLFVLGRGCWGRVRTENRSRKSSSQVPPGSAPPPAPPHGCSPLALVAKPVLPECDEAHIAWTKHLPECRCLLPCTWLSESRRRDAPLHPPHFPWEDQEKGPHLTCSPQGMLQPPGFQPFQAASLSSLLILFQQGHLTWSGQDAAPLSLRHQSTNSSLIIPHYTRLTMQGPERRNKGNRVLM